MEQELLKWENTLYRTFRAIAQKWGCGSDSDIWANDAKAITKWMGNQIDAVLRVSSLSTEIECRDRIKKLTIINEKHNAHILRLKEVTKKQREKIACLQIELGKNRKFFTEIPIVDGIEKDVVDIFEEAQRKVGSKLGDGIDRVNIDYYGE